MRKHRIRTVRTGSGAIAVQVVWYKGRTAEIEKHIGSAKNPEELEQLRIQAEQYITLHNPQQSLFQEPTKNNVAFDEIEATAVLHQFARKILLTLADNCGLDALDILYRDLAVMRIIEPCSKRRSIELLQQYFGVNYSHYLYEQLPKLLLQKGVIEEAAIKTAKGFNEHFALLLYDVTTLYFETHKPDDELQAQGFSKDDKSKQPQIVLGLLVTAQGFPLIQEVFKGNTFEGHTMLSVVKEFEKRYQTAKPIIVADAAMLSKENQQALEKEGYRYIVGARLANAETRYFFDETLKEKTEQLLGVKGYCTNIPEEELSNDRVIGYYHDLWHVEQAFRISKSDLQARPIFHYTHDAIRAHVLICFMALMIGKFIEIKTGLSLRAVRDMLWQVHDIHLRDPTTNRERVVHTSVSSELEHALILLGLKKTH
jgi:hypothetical protein